MKTLIFITLSLLYIQIEAQTNEQFKYLDINNIKVSLSSNGDFGRASLLGSQNQMPIGKNTFCGYEQAMWINATNGIGEKLESVNPFTFNRHRPQRFYSGPVSDHANSNFVNKYSRVWKVSKADIDFHKANFHSSGYSTPIDILEWPAHGDEVNGEAKNLAPFVDVNNNGYYEPQLGDYPEIRGDQALFTIINDKNGSPFKPATSKLNLEMHIMLYGYSCLDYSFAKNTYFLHYEIYNRSKTQHLNEFNIGQISIMKLGYQHDDYIGTDVNNNMLFTYNGDLFDESNYGGYGFNPPAFGLKLLNNPIYSSYKIVNNQGIFGWPSTKEDRINNLEGRDKNGVLQSYQNSNYSKYSFPGTTDPSINDNITAENEGLTPYAPSGILTTRFYDIAPGESICVDYAGIFSRGPGLNSLEQVDYLRNQSIGVQNLYNATTSKCSVPLSIHDIEKVKNYSVYLNYNSLHIERQNSSNNNHKIELLNTLGQVVLDETFTTGETQHSIDIQDIKTGTYFVRIQNETMKISIP